MTTIDRRGFLNSSLGLAAALALNPHQLARAAADDTAGQFFGPQGYAPNTLFLTWQQDPTTTMTIQWVAPPTDEDKSIRYKPLGGESTARGRTVAKPYPPTDLAVHRCELTGLEPGGEYEFQIGASSPTYRFRTMPAQATDTIQI